MSDDEVPLLETASYRLVGWQGPYGPSFAVRKRNGESLGTYSDGYIFFIREMGLALWGKERQP